MTPVSGNCSVRAGERRKDRKKRKVMPMLEEMEVLDKLDKEMSIVAFECHYDLNVSSIRLDEKNEDQGKG
jgi:hypothetical protein